MKKFPQVGGRLGGPNVEHLICIRHPAGHHLTFSPGYTTAAECLQQYKGPNVACFAYDPSLSTWTAFFKLPEGGVRTVGKITSEDECKRYIGALRTVSPPLAGSWLCLSLATLPALRPCQPPAPTQPARNLLPPDSDPKPDPASIDTKPNNIQVGGKQYTKVAGLTWVEGHPQSHCSPLLMFRLGRPSFRAKIARPHCRLGRRLRKRHKGGMYQSSMRNTLNHLRRSSTW